MKVDLGLMERPLAGTANQEYDFRLNGLDVDGVFSWSVVMAPDVHKCLLVVMTPGVPVVAVTAVRRPSEAQSVAKRLLRDANVDRRIVNANDVQLRLPRRRDSGELRRPLRRLNSERCRGDREHVTVRSRNLHAGLAIRRGRRPVSRSR